MKTGTYKLVRVQNHYHIQGEQCRHGAKTSQNAPGRTKTVPFGVWLCEPITLVFKAILSK